MKPSPLEAALPLSPLQEGMLFHALYDDEGVDVYTIQVAFGLTGELDAPGLRAACAALLERHPVLRAGFQQRKSGQPVQLVRRKVPTPWTDLDLSPLTPAEQQERLRRYRSDDRARGFDMARPPLIRFTLARLADDRHVMILTYHHILLDAWSFQIVLRDLLTLYSAGGDGDALPPAVPFERYLSWLAEQDRGAAEDAWTEALAGLGEPTLVAPGAEESAGAAMPRMAAAELSEDSTASLTAAARAAGLTLNTVVLTAWSLVLSGLTGRWDVVFGQTVSGRPTRLEDVEDIVGLLINAAPVRVRLDPYEPLGALAARIQREQAECEPHHHAGLAGVQRRMGLGELFDTSVAFGNAPMNWDAVRAPAGGLRLTAVEGDEEAGSTHYPLSLMAVPGSRLRLEVNYRESAFTTAEARSVAARVRHLLETWTAAPDTPVGRVGLLTPGERKQVLEEWNDTARPVGTSTLPRLFAAQAARTPDAVALVSEEGELTYAEMAEQVAALAGRLGAHGVGPGDTVAVALPRSAALVITLHAVQAAGAAYVPVDPDLPAERIGRILADAVPALLVTESATAAALPDTPVPRLLLDGPADPYAAPPAALVGGPTGESAAYVIFTSGSTGRPKGVMVPHSAVVNRLRWMQDRYPLRAGDRVLQKTPCGFDVSVWEFFWPLQTGATLVVARPDGHKDPAYLADLIRREAVTVAHFVPSMLQVFLQEPAAIKCTGLRRVFSSGEALPVATQNRFLELLDAELHNLYGPTEAAVDVTHWQCRPVAGPGPVPIGRPVWNTRLLVLDKALLPVPPGVAGELYLAGAQLAHGYAHRPVLTAERFVADPYGPPGTRMYRTGDVVRWTADGVLEYLGRTDDQVKIRGLRVELGEIDAVLARHPSVAQVATVVREDQPGIKRLVAYAVPVAAAARVEERQGAGLTAHAAGFLPEYMVPAAIVWLERLPLTPNGKLDRKALPAPAAAAGSGGRAPSGSTEETLCALFAEVLGVAAVGVDDSFFDLGGDSIVSIQLVSRARRSALLITPKDVFTHRTVAALARVARTADDRPEEHPDAGTGPLRATPIVHWLSERGGPSDGFHQSVLVRVPPLGADRFARALQVLLDRHDALRMRRCVNGPDDAAWTLDVAPPGAVRAEDCVRRRDVTGLDGAALRAAVAEESAAARERLDPAARRMVQAVWLDAGPDTGGRLLLAVHHLAVDGVSWRILLPDLRQAWEAAAEGGTAALDPVRTSLRTWSERMAAAALDPWHTDRLPLWKEILTGGDPDLSSRPLDAGRDVYGTGRSLTLVLPPEYTEPLLTSVPAAFHTGVNDVLLTALALAVGSWRRARGLGEDTGVLVDLEGHGREEIADGLDLSRTVGWFTSLYPVRVDPGETGWTHTGTPGSGPDALGRAVKRVKEQLRAVPDSGLGYGLLRHLNPATAAELAGHRAPQIGFNYLGRFSGAGENDWDVAAEADALAPGTDDRMPMPHVIEVNAATHDLPDGPRLAATWSWPGGLFGEADAAELAEAWFEALRVLVAHTAKPGAGGRTPSDVPLVSIGQDELEALESGRRPGAPADLLPLTPLQEGLLFHARYDSGAADVYHVQIVVELAGDLDTDALHRACQSLIDRHEALRTGFVLLRSGEPAQVVVERADVPWTEHDLRRPDGSSPRPRLDAFLDRDRRARFDMDRPPLLRFALLGLAGDRHALVFTSHHILTDGWSTSVLLRDLFTLYLSGGDPAGLPRPAPARQYAAWLAGQDREAAREAYGTALKGLPGPSLIAPGSGTGTLTTLPERITAELPEAMTAALTAAARACGVTVNTVIQGAWGLLVGELTGRRDVVFGATVSVRPPELPGIEDMVGLYINTVPVRVDADPEETLRALLVRIQAAQAELSAHHHLGPAELQRLVGGGPLYDTSIVFENYPRAAAPPSVPGGGPAVTAFYGRDAYHYPLKLMAVPGDRMYLEVSHRPELVDATAAAAVLDRLTTLLHAFANGPDTVVGALPGPAPFLPAAPTPQPPDGSPAPTGSRAEGPAGTLCALFASVLGRERFGADEDFFDEGGDSLRALRLAGRIRDALGAEPDLVTLYRHRTPAALAAALPRPPHDRSPHDPSAPTQRGQE